MYTIRIARSLYITRIIMNTDNIGTAVEIVAAAQREEIIQMVLKLKDLGDLVRIHGYVKLYVK